MITGMRGKFIPGDFLRKLARVYGVELDSKVEIERMQVYGERM